MSLWITVLFWTLAALLSALAGWLVLTLARRRAAQADGADPAVATHRRQLAEIDDLVARGLLSETEQAEVRAEAGKRLLAADGLTRPALLAGGRKAVLAAAVAAPLAAFGLYLLLGSPGRADAPMRARIAEWSRQDERTLTPQQIAAALTEVAKTRKGDTSLLSLLAENRRQSGDLFGAAKALREAVRIEPRNPMLWAQLGEIFVWTSNGEVGPDARAAFNEALRFDPKNLSARYYLGLARISDGQPAAGLTLWRAMLADLPATDPNHATIAAEIAEVERTGKRPAPKAAADADMDARIRGMVDSLAARLEANPDDPEGWVRLVRAYGVLGDTGKRDAALARARTLYKDNPPVLKALQAEAETAR